MFSHARRRHLPWLLLGVAVPALAILLDVPDGERIQVRFLPAVPLPELCMSRRLLRFDCPTCGLTRSIVYLVHGEFVESFAMHRLGWLAFALIVSQVPYRLWRLVTMVENEAEHGAGNSLDKALKL